MIVDKSSLVKYTYFDDEHKHIGILNKEGLCMQLGVSEVLFEEPEDVAYREYMEGK